jgi:hypothetical protein
MNIANKTVLITGEPGIGRALVVKAGAGCEEG